MAKAFTLSLITPETTAFTGEAVSVSVPTTMGELTILPGHIPLISTLAPGMMVVRNKDGEQFFAVSRGVVEVSSTDIRVLSDIADRVDSLDEQAIEEARKRAEALMQEKRGDAEGFAEATAILDREIARLRSVRRRPGRRR
jgi:F-type H+-transporting ATPase subunit epsilon